MGPHHSQVTVQTALEVLLVRLLSAEFCSGCHHLHRECASAGWDTECMFPARFFFIWAIQQIQERWTLTWECVLCAEARSNAFTCTPPVILGGPLFPPFYGGISGGLS